MAGALAGVEGESVEQMVSELGVVKENLRRLIQQRAADATRRRAALWLKLSANPSPLRDEAPETPRPPIAPVAPADKRPSTRTAATDKVRQLRRRERIRWVLFALLPLALIVGGYWYVTGGQVMSTDDAYVNAEKVGISTDVSGIVQEVAVKENEHVAAGQVLYRLDPRQFQIALDNAKANLAQIALMIESMKQDYKRMVSDAAAQQAQVDLDQTNYDRAAMLLKSGTATQAVFDQAAVHAAKRQEQARRLARAVAGAARQARRQSGHRRHASIRNTRQAQGASRRGAAPTGSHGGHGAVRRHRHRRAVDCARKISCRFDDRLFPRR